MCNRIGWVSFSIPTRGCSVVLLMLHLFESTVELGYCFRYPRGRVVSNERVNVVCSTAILGYRFRYPLADDNVSVSLTHYHLEIDYLLKLVRSYFVVILVFVIFALAISRLGSMRSSSYSAVKSNSPQQRSILRLLL